MILLVGANKSRMAASEIQEIKADVKMVVEVNDYRYSVFPPPKYLTLSKIVLAVLLTFKMVKE